MPVLDGTDLRRRVFDIRPFATALLRAAFVDMQLLFRRLFAD